MKATSMLLGLHAMYLQFCISAHLLVVHGLISQKHERLLLQVLRMDSWLGLLESGHLLDADLGLQQAQLCFLWSRMLVVDEIKDFARHEALSFVDFLEALARVAELKSLPSYSDLEDAGYAVLQSASATSVFSLGASDMLFREVPVCCIMFC